MKKTDIQDILPLVEQPSRYLGTEINTVHKNPADVKLRFALAFPDLYEIGTSHFGLQILYDILNRNEAIYAERVFTPAVDMEARLREAGLPLASLETATDLNRFDIVGFSLLYELDFTNILTMLDLAGIPFLAKDRDESCPLVIAGGPCTCNPEPVADFFDAIVVGDGEEVVVELTDTWLKWKEEGGDRKSLLREWSHIEGVYIPAFFRPEYDEDGFQSLQPEFPDYTVVRRALIPDLDNAFFPETPIVAYARPVHDRLRLEVARGCTRGCRFCQAGMIYRPVRERSPEKLLALADTALAATGYEDISLLSLSTGDYTTIIPLMEQLMGRCEFEQIAVSLPSLRAGTLTPELMRLIKKVRKTGFTIAPEAGSQRMRDVINKNVTEDDIFGTVQDAFRAGWQTIKLYFMVGMPTETQEDVQAIVDLVKKLKTIRPPKGRAQINVSVGTFIPKPHTPFQWHSQISLAESLEKIAWLREQFDRVPGVQFKWQKPQVSLLEGVWARGDRRLSSLLMTAWQKGCRFDGWSDHFRFDLWEQAFAETGTDVDFYTSRVRSMDEPLPWDHIDTGITGDFFRAEWERAVAGTRTSDCRDGECNNCGVCDFDWVQPVVFREYNGESRTALPCEMTDASRTKTLEVIYSKQGHARYFGHLEMVSIFLRAIRRAKIPVLYSQGFHPLPKISFNDPLPIGMESLGESFYMTVPDHVKTLGMADAINAGLPEDLSVQECHLAPSKKARKAPPFVSYRITLRHGIFDPEYLARFEAQESLVLTRNRPNGKVQTLDLKQSVSKMQIISPEVLELHISTGPGTTARPADILKTVFEMPDDAVLAAGVVKLW